MSSKNKSKNQKAGNRDAQSRPGSEYSQWLIAGVLLLTAIAFYPVFSAGFVNWDDPDYVLNNEMIRSFSDFGKFFTTTVQGNYHPLTMISLAVNYAISGTDPFSYHFVNLALHVVNVYLVYRFILMLAPDHLLIALTTALFFGVHPMHVESVAWVSERKDVLYALFYLLGLISYLKYVDQNTRKYLFYTMGWFLLSILSKPAAIVFPGALFALDYYRRRKLSLTLITEKLPFVLLSLVLVFLTMKEQTAVGATPMSEVYDFSTRAFFPFYGYMMYLVKMVWPFDLAAFYPFPPLRTALPLSYLVSPLVFLATVLICFKTWRKHREITFGFGFYLINLILVSQIFLFGSAIIADRYTYLPYVGLFFLAGWLIDQYLPGKKTAAYGLVTGLGLLFALLTFRQAGAWENTAALWDNAIRNHPSAKAYKNRGVIFQQEGDFSNAIAYLNKSIGMNINDEEAFHSLGVIYFNQGLDSLALVNFNAALNLRPNYEEALNNRGSLYAKMGKNDLARADFTKVAQLNPGSATALKNQAGLFLQENKFLEAMEAYEQYLSLRNNDAEAHTYLGIACLRAGANEKAARAFAEVLRINPGNLSAYHNLATAYVNLQQYDKARQYLQSAKEADSTNENNLRAISKIYFSMGDTANAYAIFRAANQLKGQ